MLVRTERPEPPKAFLQTQRRADASIELLRLAGYREADAMSGAARIGSNDYSKWQPLDDRVRKAWTVEMPEAANLNAKQGRWGTVERIVRAAPARIDGFDPESGFGELFGKEEVARRIWMKERFIACGKLLVGVPDAPGFYRILVDECDRPLSRGAR